MLALPSGDSADADTDFAGRALASRKASALNKD
jgi:hypothetical protein